MRVLIQVEPDKTEQVKARLPAGVSVVSQVFDYITVEMPEELIPQVRRVEGVVEVKPEKKVGIARYIPIPIEKKLAKFMELARNPLTLPQAISFSLKADAGKKAFPTSESRKMLGADEAEYEGYTGKGVKVGIIDTGFDSTILQNLGLIGKSSVEGQPFFWDENGHGTHVATTVAGGVLPTPSGTLKGVAPESELFISKALGYGMGMGTETSVMRAMMDCFEAGCDIISMSLGSPYSEESTETIPECIPPSTIVSGDYCPISELQSGTRCLGV
ncbi:MAG: S8 family serine peptidase, partial [Candidatus Bathyarchaeia archaeon]